VGLDPLPLKKELPLPKRGWRRRAERLIAICSWFYLLTVLTLWIGLLTAADLWWPATLLLFSPRWLLLLPPVPFLLAAVLRPRLLVPLVATLVLVAGPLMGFCVPWQSFQGAAPCGRHFRVLTCNMHYTTKDPTELDRLLAASRPDIVALQEWRGPSEFAALPRAEWHTHRLDAQLLVSAYPIRRGTRLGGGSSSANGLVMRYELETPLGLVTLFSVHLASPRQGLYTVVHERGQAPEGLEDASRLRWGQSENLARAARAVEGPVLLAGDFNTPPESAIFRRPWSGFTDAFGSAGWGWGYTFIGGRTLVRIDHILAGPGWNCDSCWVGPNVGSPHRPLLADLTWPAER
jgi:vancomycin resistance protein VanJ